MSKNLIKTEEEINVMREGCRILAGVMQEIEEMIDVGVSGNDIDELAEKLIMDAGCKPAFKGYGAGEGNPFPGTVCFSVNEGIVHGIPSERKIKDGDLVKIDVGLNYNGYFADMARSFLIGNVSDDAKRLVETTKKAFNKGLGTIKDGSTLKEYSEAVQGYAEGKGYKMVKNLVGHGIGKGLHEAPQIPNYFNEKVKDFVFHKGMTLALEPMVNIGTEKTKVADDGWTFETGDGSLSAHWENTILVTDKGAEILTKI